MTQKTADKHLVRSCYEAIKVIAGERKCPKCKGVGYFPLTKDRIEADPRHTSINCPTCKGTRKVGWKWEPEFGQYVIWQNQVWMIAKRMGGDTLYLIQEYNEGVGRLKNCIPLLDWQKIQEILEGVGYEVKEQRESARQSAQCWIYPSGDHPKARGKDLPSYLEWKRRNTITTFGKDRQEAVTLGVEELRKEMVEKRRKQ